MKIWKEFNSSHSSNISIVGTFENVADAEKVIDLIKDFTLSSWEERHSSIEDFNNYWKGAFPNIPYTGITDHDLETGVDNTPDIELEGNNIKISSFRTENFGGIAKLMRFAGARKIIIE
ncbi:MAG: hypothetical protein JNK73_13440 [Bacteroidia bacterium]|nr:hypothetical protein [Bacteroidia bacterium]